MSAAVSLRLALALPVKASPDIVAATRVVMFLLQTVGRLQLDLYRFPSSLLPTRSPRGRGGILFVSAQIALRSPDPLARERLERLVRAQVERQYALQGIRPVDYDLEIV